MRWRFPCPTFQPTGFGSIRELELMGILWISLKLESINCLHFTVQTIQEDEERRRKRNEGMHLKIILTAFYNPRHRLVDQVQHPEETRLFVDFSYTQSHYNKTQKIKGMTIIINPVRFIFMVIWGWELTRRWCRWQCAFGQEICY